MKILKYVLCFILSVHTLESYSQSYVTEQSSLETYLEEYPNCIAKDVIYEGCTLRLNSDGDNLFVQFSILHPELQMRILMQGLQFFVDPTGKKKEKYSITFPAASLVQNMTLGMERMEPPQRDLEPNNNDPVPDILPLISSLNQYGATFKVNRKLQECPDNWAKIGVNKEDHALTFSFLVPIEELLQDKKLTDDWTIGLYSEGANHMGSGPGSGPSRGAPGLGTPPPMMDDRPRNERNDNSADLRRMMMKDIEEWILVSFNELCSINN